MEEPQRILKLQGDESPTGHPAGRGGSDSPVNTPDVGALLGALKDSVASEDRAEDQVLSKTRNVATVAAAFFALSQSAVFSTNVLTQPESPWTGIVIGCAVVALLALGYSIYRVVEQQRPKKHSSLPRAKIGQDLLDVLYGDSRSPDEQAQREREATRKLAQHYAGLATAKAAQTEEMAKDYGAVAGFCLFAVAVTALEFAVAIISQAS